MPLRHRVEADGLVHGPIAPDRVENAREPPRQRNHRPHPPAPCGQPLHPRPQGCPRRRPTAPVGPRGLDEQPPHPAVARRRERPAALLLARTPLARHQATYAATWPALAKRRTSSRVATTAAAVTGPTPGTVHSRRAAAFAAIPRARWASRAASCRLRGPSSATNGATSRSWVAESGRVWTRCPNAAALPLGIRTPSRRRTARSTLMYRVRVRTNASRTASCARTVRWAADVRCVPR